MSLLVPSGNLLPMEEVVPDAVGVKGLSKSSILTQRRRCRAVPQTGTSYGTAANAGGGGRQVTFTIADQGGLLDPASVVITYNIAVTGTGPEAPDDGHPFTKAQVILNGQNLTDNQQAAKYSNMEVKLNTSQAWYKSTGSLCGYELLNNDLNYGAASVANAAGLQAYSGAWADVNGNLTTLTTKYNVAANANPVNVYAGQQRALPLGLFSGVGRMNQYLPLSVLGQLVINLITGSRQEVVFQASGQTDADFGLTNVAIEYDIVIPHPYYDSVLQKMANDPNEQGLNLAFESEIMATGAVIPASAASLTESSLIVSRATNNLVRSMTVFQPTSLLTSINFPSQSCFNHAGCYKFQTRIGSAYYPALAAEGQASMYAMSVGSTSGLSETPSIINREMWTVTTTAANGTISEPAYMVGGHYSFADSFIPAYNYRNVKGRAEELDLDGVSLSGASGSQAVFIVTAAPPVDVQPTVCLVAIRTIQCQGGAVRVLGA